jgi:hypothetical protein
MINLHTTQLHLMLEILIPLFTLSTDFIIFSQRTEVDGVVYRYCALYQSLWAFLLIFQSPSKPLLSDSLLLQHEQDEWNSSTRCIQGMLFSLTLQIPSSRLAHRQYICNT